MDISANSSSNPPPNPPPSPSSSPRPNTSSSPPSSPPQNPAVNPGGDSAGDVAGDRPPYDVTKRLPAELIRRFMEEAFNVNIYEPQPTRTSFEFPYDVVQLSDLAHDWRLPRKWLDPARELFDRITPLNLPLNDRLAAAAVDKWVEWLSKNGNARGNNVQFLLLGRDTTDSNEGSDAPNTDEDRVDLAYSVMDLLRTTPRLVRLVCFDIDDVARVTTTHPQPLLLPNVLLMQINNKSQGTITLDLDGTLFSSVPRLEYLLIDRVSRIEQSSGRPRSRSQSPGSPPPPRAIPQPLSTFTLQTPQTYHDEFRQAPPRPTRFPNLKGMGIFFCQLHCSELLALMSLAGPELMFAFISTARMTSRPSAAWDPESPVDGLPMFTVHDAVCALLPWASTTLHVLHLIRESYVGWEDIMSVNEDKDLAWAFGGAPSKSFANLLPRFTALEEFHIFIDQLDWRYDSEPGAEDGIHLDTAAVHKIRAVADRIVEYLPPNIKELVIKPCTGETDGNDLSYYENSSAREDAMENFDWWPRRQCLAMALLASTRAGKYPNLTTILLKGPDFDQHNKEAHEQDEAGVGPAMNGYGDESCEYYTVPMPVPGQADALRDREIRLEIRFARTLVAMDPDEETNAGTILRVLPFLNDN